MQPLQMNSVNFAKSKRNTYRMQIPDNFDDATATAADPTFKCSDSDKLKL